MKHGIGVACARCTSALWLLTSIKYFAFIKTFCRDNLVSYSWHTFGRWLADICANSSFIATIHYYVYVQLPLLPNLQGVSEKSRPLKPFGIFSLQLGLFAWNFTQLLAIHNPHTDFSKFILIFNQMALILPWVPNVFAVSSFEYWMQTFREQGLGEKAIISSYTLTKGESWALLRKSAVESIKLAQPFCVNQAVGLVDLPQRLHAQFVVVTQW